MTRTKLTRKEVTDEEFRQALANKDNEKVIKSVLSRYYSIIPAEDLEACGLEALWRCLGYHKEGKGNKFTTSLWTFTNWECKRLLKKIRRQASTHTVNISTIETKEKFEVPVPLDNPDVVHLRECITMLKPGDRELIQQYYFDRHTMEEIGNLHGYSKEAARQKINGALQELRKCCVGGV
jgi:RNA polymerase sigma factor (sigma-70 family)